MLHRGYLKLELHHSSRTPPVQFKARRSAADWPQQHRFRLLCRLRLENNLLLMASTSCFNRGCLLSAAFRPTVIGFLTLQMSRPPPLQLQFDNMLPGVVRPRLHVKSLILRLYQCNWRRLVICLSLMNGLRFFLSYATEALDDLRVDIAQHNSQLASVSRILAMLYIASCGIELFGAASAFLENRAFILTYAYLAFLSAIFSAGAGVVSTAAYFTFADEVMRECVALATAGQLGSKSLFRDDPWSNIASSSDEALTRALIDIPFSLQTHFLFQNVSTSGPLSPSPKWSPLRSSTSCRPPSTASSHTFTTARRSTPRTPQASPPASLPCRCSRTAIIPCGRMTRPGIRTRGLFKPNDVRHCPRALIIPRTAPLRWPAARPCRLGRQASVSGPTIRTRDTVSPLARKAIRSCDATRPCYRTSLRLRISLPAYLLVASWVFFWRTEFFVIAFHERHCMSGSQMAWINKQRPIGKASFRSLRYVRQYCVLRSRVYA
ncbi:hypothetical protein B0H15DRAFT_849960 [Mycena belliarum]|uniref:Uncharacterized protein n=1 Tax=Mycena belliarum TaxID=1033014 RepID=A0AAD6U472_9AGAR|nr:hypothetical protein B0H15DRAFT_849960 [Mycena belliae]